ncbi:hypothetical protein H0E84_00090 [Luteimonas sp. SJ-92]|uniref:XAC0095-like domain-containing protein n=1 Tax=Luteimonas salinisoli TaxID=2752307 RepID=A0A853J7P8_9GAMM|nr:hypothetical protein [Luteimonas salinisoli]NZA24774.1 hypothetical protein [Luteimonas salinisoli]
MSNRESDDLQVPGYFLPEDSQLRLEKLRDHMVFLSRLAQPRTSAERQGWMPEAGAADLAICLELLAAQATLVLEAVSWPAHRQAAADGPAAKAEALLPQAYAAASERFTFGVTLDQIDALGRLIQTISAHGGVVAAARAGEQADHTLPMLGRAIFEGAAAVRDLLDQVEAQRLGKGARSRVRVGEGQAVYRGAASGTAAGSLPCGISLPASSALGHAKRPAVLQLH